MAKAFEVICKDCGGEFTYYTDVKNPCPHCRSKRYPEYKPGDASYGVEIEDLDGYEDES